MTMKLVVLLILAVFASKKNENDSKHGQNSGNNEENSIVVKIEESEHVKMNKKSKYIGVVYKKNNSKWSAKRWTKNEKKMVFNGYYDDEETAAHASDTLARKLIDNGEQNFKLNFPDDHTEVYPIEGSSRYIGVSWYKNKWFAQRWSKDEKKLIYNGSYENEKTSAHASDTLARKLIDNGEQNHKLNFPDDYIEVYPKEKTTISKYIGVSYYENGPKWYARRWSKHENKLFCNGYYEDEETAAHASDTLARKLIANGEQRHKLNFPDDYTEVYPEKKKTISKYIGVGYQKHNSKWKAKRWSKNEKMMVHKGLYDDERAAAHASDTLARKLVGNGEQNHILNFPDDYTEVYPENQHKKRKRPKELHLEQLQNNWALKVSM